MVSGICEGLETCPGYTSPLTHWQLEVGPSDPERKQSVKMMDECSLFFFSFQADLDLPDLLDTPLDSPNLHRDILSPRGLCRQYSRDAATSTVSIQGSGNHYHACASDDYEDVGFDPSILPPPDPWIDTVNDDSLDANFSSSAILEVWLFLFTVHIPEIYLD